MSAGRDRTTGKSQNTPDLSTSGLPKAKDKPAKFNPKAVKGFTVTENEDGKFSLRLKSPITISSHDLTTALHDALNSGHYTHLDLSNPTIKNIEQPTQGFDTHEGDVHLASYFFISGAAPTDSPNPAIAINKAHMELQTQLANTVANYLQKPNCQLTELHINSWKIVGEATDKNDHKDNLLRKLGKALRANNSVTTLSLNDCSFNYGNFLSFFIGLYSPDPNPISIRSESNNKGSSKLQRIAISGITLEANKAYNAEAAERLHDIADITGIKLSCEFAMTKKPRERKNDPAPQIIPDAVNTTITPQLPTRSPRRHAYLIGMSGSIGFSAGTVLGSAALAAGAYFSTGATVLTILGIGLSATGVGLIVGAAILATLVLAGIAYGIYKAEKEHSNTVASATLIHEVSASPSTANDVPKPSPTSTHGKVISMPGMQGDASEPASNSPRTGGFFDNENKADSSSEPTKVDEDAEVIIMDLNKPAPESPAPKGPGR